MKAEILGIKELSKALRQYDKDTGKAFARGLGGVARQVLKEAVDITPVDTGALRASGDYFVQGTGWNAEAVVGFGFPVRGFYKGNRERVPAEYAVYQHDEPYEVRFLEISAENNADWASDLFWQEIASV
jgi:hypothetical protein